jgi:hypothetical protein
VEDDLDWVRNQRVARFRQRLAAAGPGEPRDHPLDTDLDGLARVLAQQLPRDGAVEVPEFFAGRLHADGSGYIIEAFPYGGSVIEGYHRRLTAVRADGSVVVAEQDDMWPCCVLRRGDFYGT